MIIEHDLDVPHDLGIALMGGLGHGCQFGTLFMIDGGRLGMEDEWHGEQAL